MMEWLNIKDLAAIGLGGYLAYYNQIIIKNLKNEVKRLYDRVENLEKDKNNKDRIILFFKECIFECYKCPSKEKYTLNKFEQYEDICKKNNEPVEI